MGRYDGRADGVRWAVHADCCKWKWTQEAASITHRDAVLQGCRDAVLQGSTCSGCVFASCSVKRSGTQMLAGVDSHQCMQQLAAIRVDPGGGYSM